MFSLKSILITLLMESNSQKMCYFLGNHVCGDKPLRWGFR